MVYFLIHFTALNLYALNRQNHFLHLSKIKTCGRWIGRISIMSTVGGTYTGDKEM